MKRNQFWAAISEVLAVMTVTIIMASMLAPGASAAGKPWVQLAKLTPSDCPDLWDCDTSVAISGDTVVVSGGDSEPEAYVYVKPATGWADMTETAKLTTSDGATLWSVAIDGDTVVAASFTSNLAYVFVKPAGGWVDMTETATLTLTGSGEAGSQASISGDTVVVASDYGVDGVFLFVKPASGWTNMTETAKLTASGSGCGRYFAEWLAISGDTVVATGGGGPACVFVKPAGGWTDMTETAQLTASHSQPLFAVSVSGDTVVAGDTGAKIGSHKNQGAVYVFVKPAGGWTNMKETARLTVFNGKAWDQLGFAVAVTPTRVAVTAEYSSQIPGVVYVYHKPASGWKTTNKFNAKLQPDCCWAYSVAAEDSPPTVVDGQREHPAYVFGTQ